MPAVFPLVADNDPLPIEVVAAADTVCHAAGDLLRRTSGICGAMRRGGGSLERIEQACRLAAREAEAMPLTATRIADTISMLKARAAP